MHNEELHNVCASSNTIKERLEKRIKFWLQSLKGRGHLDYLYIDGRIILEWIMGEESGKIWNGFSWLRVGSNAGLLRTRQRTSSSTEGGEFLD